ncbi:hypothetical protein [Mesorhizobium sp. YR577]|uniref:hypothetical protein n=1 Tax=Mesorhizobium sp. YR577 TaxID=1884373 RepID=UPI00158719C1|nr:hypothetical protein [Mesorhizobium sp. YR577]
MHSTLDWGRIYRAFERAIDRQADRTGNGCVRRFSGVAAEEVPATFHREPKSPAFAILR